MLKSSVSEWIVKGCLAATVAVGSMVISGQQCGGGGPPPQVGALAGSLQVSNSGAATYTVPLRVPGGIGGAVPSLSLLYSSQAGDGLIGIGWRIAGLSTISRCPRDNFIDGEIHGIDFSVEDAYCLDGQRLIEIPPTGGADRAFRTEVEQFSKIEAFGTAGTGPEHFVVTSRNGVVHEYGGTPDSRIEAIGTGVPQDAVRAYALNKVTDLSGNYYTVTYLENTFDGDFRPSHIEYTANDDPALSEGAQEPKHQEGALVAPPTCSAGTVQGGVPGTALFLLALLWMRRSRRWG